MGSFVRHRFYGYINFLEERRQERKISDLLNKQSKNQLCAFIGAEAEAPAFPSWRSPYFLHSVLKCWNDKFIGLARKVMLNFLVEGYQKVDVSDVHQYMRAGKVEKGLCKRAENPLKECEQKKVKNKDEKY